MDNISFQKEKLVSGIAKTTAVIKGTYGAAGGNVIVEELGYPYHRITNDGKLSVEKIKLADPVENIGANIIKEAGDKADRDSGDGRKTTMLLTEAIFTESQKFDDLPMVISKSLKDCLPMILASIDAQKKDITVDEVMSVATISSENEEIGMMLQEIYQKIGKEGIVEVDHSNLPETFYEIIEGVRLRNAKPIGEYSNTESGKAVYKNPKILITKDKITDTNQLEPIFLALKQEGVNELVIYCEDIDIPIASQLAYTHLIGQFKTLLIKSPTLWKDWLFEDFAKITGATVIDSKEGKTFKNMSLSDLGTCDKIIATKEETRVLGIKDISSHVKHLLDMNTDEGKLRASWLQTKVAILRVGANSESELSYISKKAKDACHASHLALKDGVVAGGGVALYNCVNDLPNTVGGHILKEALQKPMKQIVENAGIDFESIKADIEKEDYMGFDVKGEQFVTMFEAGIIDPALVIKNAVTNAVSIASTILTATSVITMDKNK